MHFFSWTHGIPSLAISWIWEQTRSDPWSESTLSDRICWDRRETQAYPDKCINTVVQGLAHIGNTSLILYLADGCVWGHHRLGVGYGSVITALSGVMRLVQPRWLLGSFGGLRTGPGRATMWEILHHRLFSVNSFASCLLSTSLVFFRKEIPKKEGLKSVLVWSSASFNFF